MRSILFIGFVFLMACQTAPKQQEKIRVIGEGKVRVKPNQVILTLQVSFTKPGMAEAVQVTQTTVDSVLTILAKYQQQEQDIKTSNVSANKEYNYNGRTQVLVGYRAEQSINFVLNDIRKFTQLTGQLLGTKITSISQIQFGHSKADSLFREADLRAYDDAAKSARKLCDRADVALGKLLYVSNTLQTPPSDEHYGYAVAQEVNASARGYTGSGFKISPEVLEFKRTVLSEYQIQH